MLQKSYQPGGFFADVAHAHEQLERGVPSLPQLTEYRGHGLWEVDIERIELPLGLLAELLTRRACNKAFFRLLDAKVSVDTPAC